jgi:hypothetical protein
MFCPECGSEVKDDHKFCHHCGAPLPEEQAVPGGGTGEEAIAVAAPVSGGREKTPWEDRETRGFFGGLFRTLADALFHPSEFFRKMPVTGGLTDPLLYALIVGMIGLLFSYLWQIVTHGTMQGMIPGVYGSSGHSLAQGAGLALLAFFSPFLIIIGLFVSAAVLHVCLMMVKGARAGFEATFRVASYGYSAYIFMVIPFCGGLLGAVWAIVLSIIGLREAHETTGGKAAFAVFLPVIACCGLVLFVATLIMGAAALSFGTLMQMQK